MVQKLANHRETASQTAGPYVHIGMMPSHAGNPGTFAAELGISPIDEGAAGTPIEITGQVLDGSGNPILDAVLESWQADAEGRYTGDDSADPKVTGFCRFAVDPETKRYRLETIKPGPVPLPDGRLQSPHIALWIVARGINIGLSTRVYFEAADHESDPVLSRIDPRDRIQTLVAKPQGDGRYAFDIRLQGPGETVFLDM